jgi:PEP-CTERM motif
MNSFATLRRGGVRIGLTLCFTFVLTISRADAAPILVENFDDVSTLAGSGWALVNASSPIGITSWFQGNSAVFAAQDGAPNSYIAANFLGADFGGNISEYLISPVLTLQNGDTLSFFTRTEDSAYNDGLEVLLGTSGGYTSLLTLTTMPDSDWTQYTLAVSGLSGPTAAVFAFHYFANDTSVNGDYIGIDTVRVDPVPEPSTLSLLGLGAAAGVRSWRRRQVRS